MATTAKRPRINKTRIHVLHDDSPMYSLDNTKRKPRIAAETMVTLKDNARQPSFIPECNDLFPKRKVWRMFVKALNKGHLFHYRNENLSDEVCFDTTPRNKPVDLDMAFIKRQRESEKNYGKRVNRNTSASAKVSDLQVA